MKFKVTEDALTTALLYRSPLLVQGTGTAEDARQQARAMIAGADGMMRVIPSNPAVDALKQLIVALTKKIGKKRASRATSLYQNAVSNALAVIKASDPEWKVEDE